MTSSARIPSHVPSSERPRFAALISGRGSNLRAILDADVGGECVGVVSSNAAAAGLDIARERGIPTAVVSASSGFQSRAAYDAAVEAHLHAWNAEWVVLAGFMRILSDELVRRWPRRIVNIHPSLLPDFPGLAPQRQAIEAGVTRSGCTVHFVAPGDVDSGPVIAQAEVDVLPTDDEATLTARILEAEHTLYPATLRRLFRNIDA